MKLKKNLNAPLLMLSIGIAILGCSLIIGYWYKWEPVSFAIDLRPGITSRSPPFSVNLTTNYLIELEVERNLPFEQLNCLLGVGEALGLEKCQAMPSPVELKWSVFSPSGKLVAQGASGQVHDGAWSSGTIDRTIGSFQGDKGNEYLVQVESLKDASVLAPTNPRITVRVHPFGSKGHYVVSGMGMAFGIVIAIMGLLWLAVRMLRRKPGSE
jgi:hypothetical protein